MERLNPAIKFISLLILTFLLAAKYDPMLNLIVFLGCLVLMLFSKVHFRSFLVLILPVGLAALGMFFTGYYFSSGSQMPVRSELFLLSDSALWNGLAQASRVLAFGGLGGLFALTTDRILLVRSFRRQFHLPQIFAYGLLAAWGIFPHMIQEYHRTRQAFRSRGITVFPVSPALLKPLLVKSVRWSEELAIAMESKGFSGEAQRTEYEPVVVHTSDKIVLLSVIVFSVLMMFL